MKKMIKILAAVSVITVSACVPAQTAESSAGQKSMHIGSEQFASSLDSALEWNGWFTVRFGIGETLFKVADDMQLEPWLAESIENINENTWRIRLKNNVLYADNTAVTAENVCENLRHVAAVNTRASYLKDAEYTIDHREITITTVLPRPNLMADLADPMFAILNRDAAVDQNVMPVGTGPYMVKSFTPDKEVTLVDNPYYWDGTPQLEEITITKMLEKETALLALQNHELDAVTEISPEGIKQLQKDNKYSIHSIPSSRVYSLYYNTETMSDLALRHAISVAIDKTSIAEYLLDQTMTASDTPFPIDSAYSAKELQVESYSFEAAKKILRDAGYQDSDQDGYIDQNGKNIHLRIAYYKRLSNEQIVTELQSVLQKLGIHSEVNLFESTEYLTNKQYDLSLYSIVTMPTGDPAYYLSALLAKDGAVNYSGYENAALIELLRQLNMEFDPEGRIKLANQIQQALLDSYTVQYIGFHNLCFATHANVINFVPHVTDYYQVTVDLDKKS